MQCSVWNSFNMIRYWYLWNVVGDPNTDDKNSTKKQIWWKTILTTKYSCNKHVWQQTCLATNNFDDKQSWQQTFLTTDNFDDKQFWWQTITTFLLDSSSKCLLSFISLFNNGETVFICFGNAFTVNRFFSQAHVQRHPFQREDYKCSLHGLRFGFSRTSVIKNKAE